MFKYLFLISVALYFLLPVANAQEVETKVVEINNKKWLVTVEPGKEPMFKSLEPTRKKVTKLPFVINGKPEEPEEDAPNETTAEPDTALPKVKTIWLADGKLMLVGTNS